MAKCFGNEILNTDGSINRTALGRIVFVDAEKLKQLNEISHPIIAEMIQREFEEIVLGNNVRIVFLEAALLIEANWYKVCGHIWVVSMDPSVALRRLQERDNLSETEAKLRVGSQLDQEKRLAYADVVLQNEGTTEELFTQTQQALRELKQSMNSSHS